MWWLRIRPSSSITKALVSILEYFMKQKFNFYTYKTYTSKLVFNHVFTRKKYAHTHELLRRCLINTIILLKKIPKYEYKKEILFRDKNSAVRRYVICKLMHINLFITFHSGEHQPWMDSSIHIMCAT